MNTQSAMNAQEFCHVLARDAKGRPWAIHVPGHKGHRYEVRLERSNGENIVCECVDPDEGALCPGCCHGKVCYHALAAVMKCAGDVGHLKLFNSYQHAMSADGGLGRLVILKAKTGSGVAYCRFYKHRKKIAVVAETCRQGALFPENVGPYDR